MSADREKFIEDTKYEINVFDIPLLFETGSNKIMDKVACVFVSKPIQMERIRSRRSMTEEQIEKIIKQQMPIEEKCRLSDFVIETYNKKDTEKQVVSIIKEIEKFYMREIVLDTETTGLDPVTGDRIVEIGAVELWNHLPTGKTFHKYLNPERNMPEEAQAVHGLTEEFLKDKPVFSQIADDFLTFIKGSKLVIHNASFDMKFINAELALAKKRSYQAILL